MDVRFVAPDWENLDALRSEAILTPFFSDERPLAGVLGLIDWRMCGFVSRMVVRGHVRGERGEQVLVPLKPRFTVDKLFLFGLGPESDFDDAVMRDTTERMFDVLAQAQVRATAIVLPGRNTQRVPAADAMETFVRVVATRSSQDEVVLLEPLEAHKDMAPILQRERRRARAASVG
jgi:hypothetical protein